MALYTFTKHASDVYFEREIKESWLNDALDNPDRAIYININEVHYIKQIKDFDNRFLRVVVDPTTNPLKIITLFFDRRIRE